MTSRTKQWERNQTRILTLLTLSAFVFFSRPTQASAPDMPSELRFIQVAAKTKEERSQIANLGISIEEIRSDSVWGFGSLKEIQKLQLKGHSILGNFDFSVARGGHENLFAYPPKDSRYHTYEQMQNALNELQAKNADITTIQSIGKTVEGRNLWALHINTSAEALQSGKSNKPGAIFMGNHHAREHLSAEIPLMLAQYLLEHRKETKIAQLLDSRDLWIIPMVNPDGAEFDIATGKYRYWRKNRRNNGDGTFGVDLNRNYGYQWGTGGSDKETSSEVYMGTEPFSEPETQAIRNFVGSQENAKILLSFHTFSELILYPWGHTYEPITDAKDRSVFEKMAITMAKWNQYAPQSSSDLYIASGDTVDWAYGEHRIFAFTFELSPKSMWNGGFYPGAGIIDKVFQDNLQPCLYLMDMAGNPYQVLENEPTGWLRSYVEPRTPELFMRHPDIQNI